MALAADTPPRKTNTGSQYDPPRMVMVRTYASGSPCG
jgi:hypothetical protein